MNKAVFYIAIAMFVAGCDNLAANRTIPDDREDITEVSDSDPEMNAAIAEAKRTLPQFVALLKDDKKQLQDIGFKYPLGGFEHIWVENVEIEGDLLTGTLANEPGQAQYKHGEAVRVPMSEVSDWAYRDQQGVMQGHYTTKALLSKIDPAEADSIRRSFGWNE